jgi:hypothetical protein
MTIGHYTFVAAILALLTLRLLSITPRYRRLSEWQPAVAALVSFAVLASALYVILSARYDTSSEKWAFGAVGTILGYWLRGVPKLV